MGNERQVAAGVGLKCGKPAIGVVDVGDAGETKLLDEPVL
jgi:hypothetical protein